MATDEKRLYPRLALKIEDGYFGHFRLADGERLTALIVNLSAGGINIAVAEAARDAVKEGDMLELMDIAGGTSFAFLKNLQAEIRWVEQLDPNGYLSVGCRFIDIPDELRRQLSDFVHAERMTRGQYD